MRYYWLNDNSRAFLSKGYLEKDTTPEDRVWQIAKNAERILGIPGFAAKFESYMAMGYYSLSTPIWTNFGNNRGLPISCFGAYIPDTMEGILSSVAEVGMQSKIGGGTAGYFGDLRPRGAPIGPGGSSSGPVHFMELFDKVASVVSQGSARRGSFAAYLPVEHPDIKEFLQIRELDHPIQEMNIAVCISDKWMEDMIGGDKEKRDVWATIIKKRIETGFPYLFFTDNVNNNAPQVYKDYGKKIYSSQLCSEILLSTDENESFVCDLSSLNLVHYEKWKETDAVETLTYFLDAVMTEFIEKSKNIKFLERARNFAINQRALGVGVLGWHSYLQSKMIPFESLEAKLKNTQIFKFIKEKTIKASREMAEKYGQPPLLKFKPEEKGVKGKIKSVLGLKTGYEMRNVCLVALAPTTSSAFILGQVSQSIEPINSNYYVQRLAKGNFTYKNPYLKELLRKYGKDESSVWDSILVKEGSVQHLEFLSEQERAVFKTFGEISQREIVIQAAARQKHIDQTQSLNLMIPPDTKPKEISELLIEGWRLGLRTFYYQRSASPVQKLARSLNECKSCEA
jgi:ribonucleoside-diphosphate reductase alpha chain